jgi:vitamin B12 transporter
MVFTGAVWRGFACSLSVSSLVIAQQPPHDAPPDTVIVIGGRIPAHVEDLTSATSLLEVDDIELRGGLTLADTLRSIPGMAVSSSGAMGGLTDLRVRGSEADHVLVLIDGIEASVTLTGGFDFAHAPGFGVERVEILRGEQSALWGSDAIGGVINIRTTGSTGEASRMAQVEAGSFGSRFAGVRASERQGRATGGLSASYVQSDGIDVSGTGGENDGYSRLFVSTAGRFVLAEGESIQWAARVADFESEFDSDSDFNGLLNDTAEHSDGRQAALGGRLTLQRFGLQHDIAVNAAQDRLETFNAGLRQSETEARRLQSYYQATADWQAGPARHRLTGLLEFEGVQFESFAGVGAGSNQTRDINNSALAADYRLSRGPARVSASLRQDQNDNFENATTWRLGGAWAFDAIGGRVRASFGDGVKNPGIYELYGFFPGSFIGNPDLAPERSRGWEIGWDQALGEAGQVSLTWFTARLDDEIYTDFSAFPFTARNRVTRSRRSGFELDTAYTPIDGLNLAASATFLDAEENGSPELRRPEFTGSLSVNWSPADGDWQIGLAADHTGAQLDTDFTSFTTVELSAYTLVYARIEWQMAETVRLYVRGTNLTDEETVDVFGYASEGRGLFVGIRFGE